MWSGPRNISTALMRSFENRPDTTVIDEPLYARYLSKINIDHPYRDEIINNGELNYEVITNYLTGTIPSGMTIWYQKHMAHHNLPGDNLKWIRKINNCILIRHPKDVILSFINKMKLSSFEQLGYKQQYQIFNYLKFKGHNSIVIDASELALI